MSGRADVTVVDHIRYLRKLPVKADAVIRKGDIVLASDAAGLCVPGKVVASYHGVGVSIEDVDATGLADGAKTVDVEQGTFLLANDGTNTITVADVAKAGTAYGEAGGYVVGNDSTNKSPVGKIVGMGWNNLPGVQVEIRSR